MNYTVRPFREADLEPLHAIDKGTWGHFKWDRTIDPLSRFCAADERDRLIVAGALIYKDANLVMTIVHLSSLPEDEAYRLKVQLADALVHRYRELHEEKAGGVPRLLARIRNEQDRDFYEGRGFWPNGDLIQLYLRDVSASLPLIPQLPPGVEIRPWPMRSAAEKEAYLEADRAVLRNDYSMEMLNYMQGGPVWFVMAAFHGDTLIGSSMSWGTEIGITERLFTLPGWRRQGIAKGLLAASLRQHCELGRTHVSAAVSGTNEAGIALLRASGFEKEPREIRIYEYC